MKKRILALSALVALILIASTIQSRQSQVQSQGLFIGIFKPTNPDFVKNGPSPEQMPLIKKHVEYLQGLTDRGISIVAGHTTNHDANAFGLVLVHADSETAARKIMEEDALIHAGILTVTVFPFEGLVGKNGQP